MKIGFKLVLVTLPLAALGAGILAYVIASRPPPAQTPLSERATAVRVIRAETRAVAPRVTGFGLVEPAHVYEAIAQVGGTVDYVNPDLRKGAILPAGSVLMRLSPADFNLAIAQARANIRAAEAKLAELAVSEANQRAALSIETEAQALKEKERERVESLFQGGTASQSALDAVQSATLTQRQKVLTLKSALSLIPTQRQVQREQIAVYRANLETAALNLARTELTLPFAARVASAPVETGEYVRAGYTAAVLDGIETAEVAAQVPLPAFRTLMHLTRADSASLLPDPSMLTRVLRQSNLTAEVRLSLGPETVRWPARVDRISDTLDPRTGTLGVIVQVDDAYAIARPGDRPPLAKGMFVEVVLTTGAVSGTVIPRSALRDGQALVVGADSRLELIPVTPLLLQDGIAVIAAPDLQDRLVVVSDPGPILPGMLLQTTPDPGLIDRLIDEGSAP